MAHRNAVKKLIAGTFLSAGVALSGIGLTTGTAEAQIGPVPLDADR